MRKPFTIVLLLLLAAFGAACGGDNPAIEGPTTTAPEPTDEPTEDCDDQSGAATAEITMVDSSFDPACVIVEGDADLTLVNNGAALHNFTLANTSVDVDVDPGASQELGGPSPAEAGEHVFYCKYHGTAAGDGMAGTMTIV
ncbi:MAG: cupredoxin domain-containing protein [Actinomycetota bacterium]